MKRTVISTVCCFILIATLVVSAVAAPDSAAYGPVGKIGYIMSSEDSKASVSMDESLCIGEYVEDGVGGLAFPPNDTLESILQVGIIEEEEVTDEEIERVINAPQSRASSKPWTIDLSGDSLSKPIYLTGGNRYFKVWIKNSGTKDLIVTFTSGSPTGPTLVDGIKTLPPGEAKSYHSREDSPLSGVFYVNFTSGKADMVGIASCRIASTFEELDI